MSSSYSSSRSLTDMITDIGISIKLIVLGLISGITKFTDGFVETFRDPQYTNSSMLNKIVYLLPKFFVAIFAGIGTWLGHIGTLVEEEFPRVRKNDRYQSGLLLFLLILAIIIVFLRPAASSDAQIFFLANVVLGISIFAMMAIALNLQTGMTGIVNFGVIFFVGVGAITTSIATTRYGLPPIVGMILGMIISGLIGYLLAYPSLKLRSDYFAIITLSLGEVLRRMMLAETFLQTKQPYGYSVGITNVKGPLQDIFARSFYIVFLATISILALLLVYYVGNRLIYSPYGRVMRAIREDEEVVESYGYNIFQYKASILAIGGALFAIPGSFIAWRAGSITPGLILVTTTFYVWGAFIIGGKGNNKGMIAGATIIVLSRDIVRALSAVDRSESIILSGIDSIYRFIVVDIGGTIFGNSTWAGQASKASDIQIDLAILQIFLVGLIIVIAMNKFQEGLIPELPYLINKHEAKEVERNTTSTNPMDKDISKDIDSPEEIIRKDSEKAEVSQ